MSAPKATLGTRGTIQGTTKLDSTSNTLKCNFFGGVPYALPPTGARRWQKPHPLPEDFSYGSKQSPGVFTQPSPVCPQMELPMVPADPNASEDCLRCNVYVPLGDAPEEGWAVFVYLHGGFLQFGSPSFDDPSMLFHETNVKCIIVSPGYRVGPLGFLSSEEVCNQNDEHAANFGFWDQRLAIEWTFNNIAAFGGNPTNITVGGLSAGSYSTFHQLAYDLKQSKENQIIRRCFMWSNGCGVQPKTVSDTQAQFENFLAVLNISAQLAAAEKMARLREISAADLAKAASKAKQKFFRPVTDGEFISADLFQRLSDGSFGKQMQEAGICLMIGDLTEERNIYQMIFPPASYQSLVDRLCWDFPRKVALAACASYGRHSNDADWMEIFGQLYADLQVHATSRGLVQNIADYVPLERILRYRIEWRAEYKGDRLPMELGPTHGTDLAIWFVGNGVDVLAESQKAVVRRWLEPLEAFLTGYKVQWGTKSISQVRSLTSDGDVVVKEDEIWDEKLSFWKKISATS